MAYDYKQRYDALSERDRKIWDLHRKSTNALGFALQNTHSENIQIRYERQSDAADMALWDLLTTSEVPSGN